MRINDLTGQRFGRLTAIEIASYNPIFWTCKCDCGNIAKIRPGQLRSGHAKSCGCLKKINHKKINGESRTALYRQWVCMIKRCYDTKHQSYKFYGGRGISVCDEWRRYEGFRDWALKTKTNPEYSLERIDVNGNYSPSNCTWVTWKQQARNRRSSKMIEYKGETKCLAEWCEELNADYSLINSRLLRGWDFEKALKTPPRK